ncbi:MAG: aminodeoxychorismate synthase, component I [Candidatus Marinimicrobia bacterium]|nr:aminodeoxychorismate synthase, component I [Candidatus Neomarinimicrobiota bacterium]|tara:strand:+ start:72250 stop:73464 length:1215 start_codon:yes stop_codon:yes gene_type:complete
MNQSKKTIDELVALHGTPDALIDNHNDTHGYAIWGFRQILSYDKTGLYLDYIKQNENINPFNFLQSLINKWIDTNDNVASLGFLSYDIKNILYPHIQFKNSKRNFPYMWFAKPAVIKSYIINSNNRSKETTFFSKIQDILSIEEYKVKIQLIKEELKKGNTYQINFTMPELFATDIHPFDIYLAIRKTAKPNFGYYLNTGEYHILSFSPEEFFHTTNNIIKTYPMKGTKPRGSELEEDIRLKHALKNSDKDRAEHVMIVDLLRNDLGKICKYGTVKVDNLFQVNSYPTVHQMVSCVYGLLDDKINHIDILKALHPGGSITGAPKESSLKIIDKLETYNREIYTGSIGFINSSGDMHFNMAIRTLSIKNKLAKYGVGGGIVWESNVIDEWNEAKLKSKILSNYIE